jgi:hypothetical protein
MLRVEPSNLLSPRGPLRPRRLLPHPPGTQRPGASKARHEMLPPKDDAESPSVEEAEEELTRPDTAPPSERWSVRLELGNDDIAKLYGQGMTRGAVVWRKGMMEWRPLLVTPELTGVLRRTRTTLTPSLPPLPSWVDAPPALPKPPRLPSTIPPGIIPAAGIPTTIAPVAMELAEASRPARRPVELAAVAVAAFALAWVGHGALRKPAAPAGGQPAPAAAPAASACEPQKAEPLPAQTLSSTIPTVAVGDLPLAGNRMGASTSAPTVAGSSASRGAPRAVAAAGPATTVSRAELLNALGGVARAASGCGERGGPVRVVVSFANSGVARSIQVSGEDLPSATRSCIIGAASRARVPAFTGEPITVSKTL